jgi:membrane protease YdiL (CAAX protease family)
VAANGPPNAFVRTFGAWLACAVALYLALPWPVSLGLYALGCAVGLVLCVLGFQAADRTRGLLPDHTVPQRLKLATWSLALGTALGGVLLGCLWLLARDEPSLQARFVRRLDEPIWRPWALAFESSILEEIVFRLFLLSCTAWLVARFSPPDSLRPFGAALVVSAVLFGLVHLPAWAAATSLSWFLVAVVLLLNGIGAFAFGWLFWRWGLVYAILCHFAGDVVIQAAGPRILG